jgi:hypothetical protein
LLAKRDFHLQTGNLGYKTGLSFTNGESWVTNGILGLLFTKNNWKLKIIMEQFGWTRKFLYHKILVELSDIYDLELEEKFYVQRFGYRPEYKLDLLDGSKSLARLATGYINYLLTEEGDY